MTSIPFTIPSQFLAQVDAGQIIRYGAILKDASSGNIVGHLQQTGGLFEAIGRNAGGPFRFATNALNPLGSVSSVVGALDSAYQNRKMNLKLDQLQSMVGGMQTLGLANLATSVIGIGVTVAATKIILSRMTGIKGQLDTVEARLESLPSEIEEGHLRGRIVDVQTSLERFAERETRKDSARLLAEVEESLHRAHDQFAAALERMSQRSHSDPELIITLLQGILLSSSTSLRALLAADEVETARDRAKRQAERFQSIVWEWPDDKIAERLRIDDAELSNISTLFKEGMAQQSTQPSLFQTLLNKGYKGSDYIKSAQEEREEPLLFLATIS